MSLWFCDSLPIPFLFVCCALRSTPVENHSCRDSKAPTSERSAGSVVSVDIGTVVDVDVPMLCSVLSTLSVVATRLPVRLNSEVYGAGATLVELVVELALTVVVKVDVSKPTLEVVAEIVSEVAAVAEVAEPVEVVDTVLVTLDVLVDDLVPQLEMANCNGNAAIIVLR